MRLAIIEIISEVLLVVAEGDNLIIKVFIDLIWLETNMKTFVFSKLRAEIDDGRI